MDAHSSIFDYLRHSYDRKDEYAKDFPRAPFMHLPQLESPTQGVLDNKFMTLDVIACDDKRRDFKMEIPTLEMDDKSIILGCDEITNNYAIENGHWSLLETLIKNSNHHHPLDVILFISL